MRFSMAGILMALAAAAGSSGGAAGQSSSLFLKSQSRRQAAIAATSQPYAGGVLLTSAGAQRLAPANRNEALLAVSLTAVAAPEPKEIQVNDFVGVIIRHRMTYQSNSRLNSQVRWDLETQLNDFFRIHGRRWVAQDFERGTPKIDLEHQNNLRNTGQFDRRDFFETRVQAKVLDIKPNGNLILAGLQRVVIDSEDQIIRFTGECNKDDVLPNRTITGDKVYALNARVTNSGAVKDTTKRGWLKSLLDKLKPF